MALERVSFYGDYVTTLETAGSMLSEQN